MGIYLYYIGCIINVSSLLAVKGGLGASVYAASKAGVIGMYIMSFFLSSLLFPFHVKTPPKNVWKTRKEREREKKKGVDFPSVKIILDGQDISPYIPLLHS